MIIASANGRRFALARVLLTASTDAFLPSYNTLTRRFSALCATSTTSTLNSYPPTPADLVQCFSPKEWEQRCSLAVAYRIAYLHSWHENIFNHITLKVDGSDDSPDGPHFLLNDFGLGFDEITASNILKVNLDGVVVDQPVPLERREFNSGEGRVFKPGMLCSLHCIYM